MSEENVEIVRGLYGRWGEGDFGDIITLRDGRIIDWKSYWNPDEAFAAAGLAE